MSSPRSVSFLVLGLAACLGAAGCSATLWQVHFVKPAEHENIRTGVAFLKCHLHSGEVYVFDKWQVHKDSRMISGSGLHYASTRRLINKGDFELPLARVALLETDQPESVTVHGQYAAMGVLSVISLTFSIVVLALLVG